MTGFDPNMGGMDPQTEALRRLARMLRDVGFGPSAALRRLFGGGGMFTPFPDLESGSSGGLGGGTGGGGGASGGGGGSGFPGPDTGHAGV